MTELFLRSRADPGSGLAVSSAGVHALVGRPMDEGAATAMVQLGFNPTQHRARQFEPAMAATADLILTAEKYHLETVLQQVPTALRKTFTIKEFARIAPYLRPGTPARVVAQAAAARGLVPRPADPGADDVADPHGQPVSVNRATAAELTKAVEAIVGALGVAKKRAAGADEPARRRPKPYKR
jgi:protein-tyrosine phosphatase